MQSGEFGGAGVFVDCAGRLVLVAAGVQCGGVAVGVDADGSVFGDGSDWVIFSRGYRGSRSYRGSRNYWIRL